MLKLAINIFLLAAVCALSNVSVAQINFVEKSCTNCGTYQGRYFIYLPSGYDINKPGGYPLIVHLHGQSQAERVINNVTYPPNPLGVGLGYELRNNRRTVFDQYEGDFIIALPAEQSTEDWDVDNNKLFLDYLKGNPAYNIDENRVFFVGVSMGAKGSWDYAMKYPEDVAAIVPLMGGSNPIYEYCNMVNIPVWAFHGTFDGNFPIAGDSPAGRYGPIKSFNTIESECTPNVPYELVVLESIRHQGWNEIAGGTSGFDIFEWLLQINGTIDDNGQRAVPIIEGSPIINIGPDRTFVAPISKVTVDAYVFDPDGGPVTNLSWNITPSATITQFGRRVEITDLAANDYTLTLTAIDNDGQSKSKSVTLSVVNSVSPTTPLIDRVELYEQVGNTNNFQFVTNLGDYQNLVLNNLGEFRLRVFGNSETTRATVGLSDNHNLTSWNTPFYMGGINGGNPVFIPEEGRFTLNVFGRTGNNEFSEGTPGPTRQFIMEISLNPLPVKFIGFNGKSTLNGVNLKWLTTDEENNSHFEVYRKREGGEFQKLGEVPRTSNPSLINEYGFTDYEAEGGIFYYQVKSVDFDGHFDLTEIIRVDVESAKNQYYLYPNPVVNTTLSIRIPDAKVGKPIQITVRNASGKEVGLMETSGINQVQQLDVSNLPSGLYHTRIFQDGEVHTLRFIRK
ncbi:T9SS type A sorting domain-containing protein [Fulvivirga sedimenti]|uniref:T9SS type A sorting domain-containing protein n=1 Tax=Fulvivirga sedimenti TaxID=2879465 RepID=A0A9X1HKT9_9BACT|nr:T9SS type A sorting domain-containing protein [Fulvivirga sedimenti]MCA6073731.1 T9SS type A sorting domain-containing protein [Fulvivirga sedimenti]